MKKFFIAMLATVIFFLEMNCVSAEKIKFDNKILKKIQLEESPADMEMVMPFDGSIDEIEILGKATATKLQMVNYIRKHNPQAKLNCSIEEIVDLYYEEASIEGIRPDIAICQAIKETGFWNYGGDVDPKQNNYCGLGATGNKEPGASFESPRLGVRAHIQHLLAYTSTNPPKTAIVDPRYMLIARFKPEIFGKIKTWKGLGGVWAVPGIVYGEDIVNLWRKAIIPDGGDESVAEAKIKIQKNPESSASYVYRGIVNYERGDYKNSQADLQKAAEIEPLNADILYNLAIAAEKNKDYKAAIKTYDKYLELAPKEETAYYNRGRIKLAQKDFVGAIKDFEKTLELEDRFVYAQNDIAICYFRQKKYSDALTAIRKAAEINTTNKIVNANLEKFEKALVK